MLRKDSSVRRRRNKIIKVVVALMVFSLAADYAMAQLPGPFSFSFASPLLNALFLWPLTLGGCV
jgi:hypothetical protein